MRLASKIGARTISVQLGCPHLRRRPRAVVLQDEATKVNTLRLLKLDSQ